MRVTGNRDVCFFNERCYRPADDRDYPMNNVTTEIRKCGNAEIRKYGRELMLVGVGEGGEGGDDRGNDEGYFCNVRRSSATSRTS